MITSLREVYWLHFFHSDAAVWSSLRQSHLADFVTGLASGLQVGLGTIQSIPA